MKRELEKRFKRITALMLAFIMSSSLFGPSVNASAATTVVTAYRVVSLGGGDGYEILDDKGQHVTSAIVEDSENLGVVQETISASEGMYILKSPSKDGFSFNGWYVDSNTNKGIDRLLPRDYEVSGEAAASDIYVNHVQGLNSATDHLYNLTQYYSDETVGIERGFCLYAKWTYSPSQGSSNTVYITNTVTEVVTEVVTEYVTTEVNVYYYNVSFASEYGNSHMDSVNVKDGEEYTLPKCGFKTPAGTTFKHWEIDGKAYNPGDKITVNHNIKVKAVWGTVTIMKGEPKWEWETVSFDASGSPVAAPKAKVTITLASSDAPNKTKKVTFSDNQIEVTRDDSFAIPGIEVGYRAKVVGNIGTFYKSGAGSMPVTNEDLTVEKVFQKDVFYAPKVKWYDKWPVILNKASGNPVMRYNITYTSKKTGKTYYTASENAIVVNDLDGNDNAYNATFKATVDLSKYYTKEDGLTHAEDAVNTCRYIYPNGGKDGISGSFSFKNVRFGWNYARCEVSANASYDASGNPNFDVSKINLTPTVSAEAIYSVAKDGARISDVVINSPVTFTSEVVNDGKAIKYTASTVTYDDLVKTESRYICYDPYSVDFGKQMKGIVIEGVEEEYEYLGGKVTPDFRVVNYDDGCRVLTYKSDYTVSFKSNNKVGTATLTVKITKGKYKKQTIERKFKLVNPEKDDSTDYVNSVTGIANDLPNGFVYNGEAHYPDKITINTKSDGAIAMVYDGNDGYVNKNPKQKGVYIKITDNINVGKATVWAWGNDGRVKKLTFKINCANFETLYNYKKINIEFNDGDTYSFSSKMNPGVTVSYGDMILKEGTDYKLSYSKYNKKTCTGTVAVTGKNNFKGTINNALKYYVVPFDLSEVDKDDVMVDTIYDKINSKKIKLIIYDDFGNEIPASRYTISAYKDGVAVSELKKGEEYTLKVEANSKYKDNYVGNFEIDGVSVGTHFKAKVKLEKDFANSLIYEGEPVILEEILDGKGDNPFENGKIKVNGSSGDLIYGVDYVVARYVNNDKAGKMTLYIKGIGKYSGICNTKITIH